MRERVKRLLEIHLLPPLLSFCMYCRLVVTFAVSLSERRRYCGARRPCVCVSVCLSSFKAPEKRVRIRRHWIYAPEIHF